MPQKQAILVVIGALLMRLLLLDYPALMDPTEGRYAYVGQEMVLSNDWVTPKIPGISGSIPYLGKPPLHFWMTALSLKIFGMEAWSARLPSYIDLLVISLSIILIGRYYLSKEKTVLALLFLICSGMGFVTSGSVIIDLTLTACVSMAFCGYLLWKKTLLDRWGLVIFVSLALGFLTKGPIAVLLFAFPVLVAEFPFSKLTLFKPDGLGRLPWVKGILVGGLIALPWFILAENRNPGFLRYFFLNENLLRFFVSNYGDKYGTGHKYPFGSSWWMFAFGFLPWTPLLLLLFYKNWRRLFESSRTLFRDESLDSKFFIAWLLSPILIFTFSKQLHLGYVVPSLPGAAIVLAKYLEELHLGRTNKYFRIFTVIVGFGGIVFFCLGLTGSASSTLLYFSFIPLLGSIVAMMRVKKSTHIISSTVIIMGLAISSSLALCLTALAGTISDQNSTESILACRANDRLDPTPDVTVFGVSNFTAEFYSRANNFVRPVNVRILRDIGTDLTGVNDIIVRRSQIQWAPAKFIEEFGEATKIGRWIWMHRKSVPLEIDECQQNRPFNFDRLRIGGSS